MRNFFINVLRATAGQVLMVGSDGRFGPVDPSSLAPAGDFAPATNNTRDLGLTGTRWRTAYLGTALDAPKWTYAGSGEIDLTGGATRTLTIRNSTASQVTNVDVDGSLTVGAGLAAVTDDAVTNAVTRGLMLSHTTSGTATAGIGSGMLLRAESAAGTTRSAGAVDAIHTDATDGAEVSVLVLSAARAGTLVEAARFASPASAVNSLYVTGSATGQPVALYPQGSDSNTILALSGKGSSAVQFRAGNGTTMLSVANAGISVYADSQLGAAPTVSRPAGVVQVDSGATSVTVTNTLVSATSLIFAMIRNATSNAVSVLRVVPSAGTFDIVLSGDPGASHAQIAFLVVNPGA